MNNNGLPHNIEAEKFSGMVICLEGDLGSGKTLFTKGFAASLEIDENWIPNETEQDLVRLIAKFPQVVEDCANKKRVHNITQYCQDLAGSFNKFYKSEQVIGSDVEDTRLILVDRAKTTIKNALDILGVPAPEKM